MALSTMKNSFLGNVKNLGQVRWISKDIRMGSESRLGMLAGKILCVIFITIIICIYLLLLINILHL